MQSISRSVDRVFDVLQLFKRERRPLRTADVRQALGLPHSSTVVLLTQLTSLGYLRQDPVTHAYFPSRALHDLCGWIREASAEDDPVARLVERVYAHVGETTSVSRILGMFSMTVYAHAAEHADAVDVRPGITGGLLTLSVVGRALLSTQPDPEIRRFIEFANGWAKIGRIGVQHDSDSILRTIAHIRSRGYLFDCNLLLPNVAAVSFPLVGAGIEAPLALTIAASARRMERQASRMIHTAEREVARFREEVALLGTSSQPRRASPAKPRRARASASPTTPRRAAETDAADAATTRS